MNELQEHHIRFDNHFQKNNRYYSSTSKFLTWDFEKPFTLLLFLSLHLNEYYFLRKQINSSLQVFSEVSFLNLPTIFLFLLLNKLYSFSKLLKSNKHLRLYKTSVLLLVFILTRKHQHRCNAIVSFFAIEYCWKKSNYASHFENFFSFRTANPK